MQVGFYVGFSYSLVKKNSQSWAIVLSFKMNKLKPEYIVDKKEKLSNKTQFFI